MSYSTLTLLFSSLAPWLVVLLGLQALANRFGPKMRGGIRITLLGLVAAGLLAAPVRGISIAAWVRGVAAGFSIPATGLLALAVWQTEFRKVVFSKADWRAAWVFGALAGLVLYPLALGLTRFDPYVWGWHFSPLFAAVAALSALLLWRQNRFGFLLLLAVAAYQLRLLESANYWDYLLDPVYWAVSLLALAVRLARVVALSRPAASAPAPPGPPPNA